MNSFFPFRRRGRPSKTFPLAFFPFFSFFFFPFFSFFLQAEDSVKATPRSYIVAPFPVVNFNSELGLQLGLMVEMTIFGSKKEYPNYEHKMYLNGSFYTKGSGFARFFYDSECLLPRTRVTADFMGFHETMSAFFGFNGYSSPYLSTIDQDYYKVLRKSLKAQVDFQYMINRQWNLLLGASYYQQNIQEAAHNKQSFLPSLYSDYLAEGLVGEAEKNGGEIAQMKVGMVFDTRDKEADPTRGFWAEGSLGVALNFLPSQLSSFGLFSFMYRHYLPLWDKHLTFAYKIAYQGSVYGETPWYYIHQLNTSYTKQNFSEGLGGFTTLRGVLRNRIGGAAMAWANLELRYRLPVMQLWRRKFYFAVNPFFDCGMITRKYRGDRQSSSSNPLVYSGEKEALHSSAGLGLKLVVRDNFVLSGEFGKALDPRDGSTSFALFLNYLF